MSTRLLVLVSVLLTVFVSVMNAAAQVENDIAVSAVGNGSSIEVTVSMDIGGTLPASWVGWVVDRTTLGVCGYELRIGGVTPFPTGVQEYVLTDTDVITNVGPPLTYKYRVYAIDDQGERQYLGSPPTFPPAYYHDAYASVGPDPGAVAGGTIVDLGYTLGVELCPDDCWEPIAFISNYYLGLELENLAGTAQEVWLVGIIDNDFEGAYIDLVTDVAWPRWGCFSPLDNPETSWGALKSRYR